MSVLKKAGDAVITGYRGKGKVKWPIGFKKYPNPIRASSMFNPRQLAELDNIQFGKGQYGSGNFFDTFKRFIAGKTKVKPSDITKVIGQVLSVAKEIPGPQQTYIKKASDITTKATKFLKKHGRGTPQMGSGMMEDIAKKLFGNYGKPKTYTKLPSPPPNVLQIRAVKITIKDTLQGGGKNQQGGKIRAIEHWYCAFGNKEIHYGYYDKVWGKVKVRTIGYTDYRNPRIIKQKKINVGLPFLLNTSKVWNDGKYHMISHNCQDFALWLYNKASSRQSGSGGLKLPGGGLNLPGGGLRLAGKRAMPDKFYQYPKTISKGRGRRRQKGGKTKKEIEQKMKKGIEKSMAWMTKKDKIAEKQYTKDIQNFKNIPQKIVHDVTNLPKNIARDFKNIGKFFTGKGPHINQHQYLAGEGRHKKQKGRGTRIEVWNGNARKTGGGLTKADLMMNKRGKIISKKMYQRGKGLYKSQKGGARY